MLKSLSYQQIIATYIHHLYSTTGAELISISKAVRKSLEIYLVQCRIYMPIIMKSNVILNCIVVVCHRKLFFIMLLRPPCIFFFYLSLLHPTTLNSYLVPLFSPYLTRLINRNMFRYYIEATRRA